MNPASPDDQTARPGRAPASLGTLRGPLPEGFSWIESTWSQELPVTLDQVWAVVTDPARRPEWDPGVESVTVEPDGTERLTNGAGTARTQRRIQLEPGHAIAWRRHRADAAEVPAGAAGQIEQLLLEGQGTRTVVQLHVSSPARGTGVRLSRPLLRRMMRAKLRRMITSIGRASGAPATGA